MHAVRNAVNARDHVQPEIIINSGGLWYPVIHYYLLPCRGQSRTVYKVQIKLFVNSCVQARFDRAIVAGGSIYIKDKNCIYGYIATALRS